MAFGRGFFTGDDTIKIARELLGMLLVHKTPEGVTGGMIVEAEAYIGAIDKASHAYTGPVTAKDGTVRTRCGKSARTRAMFDEGGVSYIYLIYGMHYCFNVVTGKRGEACAVLIRALRPLIGLDLMKRRRKTSDPLMLCSGPGRLCEAMGITKEQYGMDLLKGELTVSPFRKIPETRIGTSARINVDYAEEARDFPWRFFVRDDPFVSGR